MKLGTNWRSFTAGHRIPWHEKCGRMHGHTWRVRVEVEGDVDPMTGILVDFSVLAKSLDKIIEPWDHKFLAGSGAKLEEWEADESWEAGKYYTIDKRYVLPESDVVEMPMTIVSSENLATYILSLLALEIWPYGKIVTVEVSESGDNVAKAGKAFPAFTPTINQYQTWIPSYNWGTVYVPSTFWPPSWVPTQ